MNAETKIKAADKPVPTGLAALRVPFKENEVSKLPKPYKKDSAKGKCNECGGYHGLPAAHLDYVGHAALTNRLLDVDPQWTWEPMATTPEGLPLMVNGGLWIKLTVCGVTRLGYGDADGKTGGNAIKEAIGDALRNAGMRFGCALDLWHKGDLHAEEEEPDPKPDPKPEQRKQGRAHGEGFITEAQRDIIQQAADAAHVTLQTICEHFGLPHGLLDLHANDFDVCMTMLRNSAAKREAALAARKTEQRSFETELDDGVPY